MIHPIYRVVSFAIVAPYTLRVTFDDTTTQVIDFLPILEGELYGPLRDASLFNQVQLDPEVETSTQNGFAELHLSVRLNTSLISFVGATPRLGSDS